METQGFDICSFLGFWVTLEILSFFLRVAKVCTNIAPSTTKSKLFIVDVNKIDGYVPK